MAEQSGRQPWLQQTIRELIASQPLWRKAKGLTLASFSNMPSNEFDQVVKDASVANTWVERQVQWLKENLARNEWARHWYKSFLSETDQDRAWGSFTMTFRCADERFYTWCALVESRGTSDDDKLRHVRTNSQYIRNQVKKDGKRKDTLFGIKVQRGEVFPFVDLE